MSERKISKPILVYEACPDETCLVGTDEDLREFASKILEVLNHRQNVTTLCDVPVQYFPDSWTSSLGSASIHGIVITRSKDDKRKLVNKILANNGDLPIDWAGYDDKHGKIK